MLITFCRFLFQLRDDAENLYFSHSVFTAGAKHAGAITKLTRKGFQVSMQLPSSPLIYLSSKPDKVLHFNWKFFESAENVLSCFGKGKSLLYESRAHVRTYWAGMGEVQQTWKIS